MNKKIISFISAITAFCAVGQAFAAGFSDLDKERYAWCYSEIEEMADAGYINGYEDGTFRPDNEVTKLEGIALFARAMGSGEEINSEILELAHAKYDNILKQCGLAWGSDELAYMLYKGAFTEDDIKTYVMGTVKNETLSRGEAAVIMTKAMGGEQEALKNTSVSLTYLDSTSIPRGYLQYVAYVTEHGIMQGTDNNFLADEEVTRSQITLMLKRAVEACEYSFINAKLVNIDAENKTIVLNSNGNDTEYTVADNAVFRIKGEETDITGMPANIPVTVQLSGDTVLFVDSMTDEPDTVVTGIFSEMATSNGETYIRVKDSVSSTSTTAYKCIDNVPVKVRGSAASLKSLQSGDAIEFEVSGGKVQSITVTEKIEEVTGATVTSLDIDGDKLYMTISCTDAKYDGKTYEVASDATVKKSNQTVDMTEVYEGDRVTLELRYGVVTSVVATSTRGSASGSIVSILIAEQPEITIRVDGKNKTYQVPHNCNIVMNQKEGSIYDFRVGDNVTVTTVSDAVTKIQASTAVINTEGGIQGVVNAVNNSYGFITVMTESSDVPYTVFKTANNTTIITTKGKTIDFKSIKVGDTVECRGTTTNGAFVATLIMVTPAE